MGSYSLFRRVVLIVLHLFLSLSQSLHVHNPVLIGWIVLGAPHIPADIPWRLCLRPIVRVVQIGSDPLVHFLHPVIVSLVHLPYLPLLDVVERPVKLPLLLLRALGRFTSIGVGVCEGVPFLIQFEGSGVLCFGVGGGEDCVTVAVGIYCVYSLFGSVEGRGALVGVGVLHLARKTNDAGQWLQ